MFNTYIYIYTYIYLSTYINIYIYIYIYIHTYVVDALPKIPRGEITKQTVELITQ